MATKFHTVLLGLEDEIIREREKQTLNYTVNKIGGKPDWCSGTYPNPDCKLCGRKMPLVVQVYAPLDRSQNHRTLFVFGCVNRQCQKNQESWLCLRDEVKDVLENSIPLLTANTASTVWFDEANDWGEEENMEGENGNSSNNNDNFEEEIDSSPEIETLSLDDPNANCGGAVGKPDEGDQPSAELEIEAKDESVTVETPLNPTVDVKILFQTPADALPELEEAEFISFYLLVVEEIQNQNQKLDTRAKELWAEYQRRENCDWKKLDLSKISTHESENYEKTQPTHGDELIHKFITRVQYHPEQLIRYSREGNPLLLRRLKEPVSHCLNCGASMIYEMQLMPHLSQCLSLMQCPQVREPVELGTALIFTCSNSCWNEESPSLREEIVIFQSEMF